MFGQLGLAKIAQIQSLSAGYIAGGIVTVFTLPALAVLRRLNNKADIIEGKAGQHGPCAGQGLPDVSAAGSDMQKSDRAKLPS